MLFTTSTWQDIDKYYHGTYTKFKEFGDKLFRITQVTPHKVSGIDQDDVEFDLFLSDEHPYEVDYVLPHRAVFQYRDRAFLMQRVPARQYKRGLCEGNVRIINVDTGEAFPIGFAVLKSYVTKQQYFTFGEAIKRKGKLKSYALNSRMSLSVPSYALRIDTTKIGFYSVELKKLFVNPLFIPDVLAQLKNNNETMEVVPHE